MVRHLVRLLRKFTHHVNKVLNEKKYWFVKLWKFHLIIICQLFLCSYYFLALVTKKFLKFTGKCSSQVNCLIVETSFLLEKSTVFNFFVDLNIKRYLLDVHVVNTSNKKVLNKCLNSSEFPSHSPPSCWIWRRSDTDSFPVFICNLWYHR